MYPMQDPHFSQRWLEVASYPVLDSYPNPSEGAPYPPLGSYPGVSLYPPQDLYMDHRDNIVPSNAWARQAMIYGIISLILSLFTLITLIGFTGLITGTFAIVYGFQGLNVAHRQPGNARRGQAIVGIVLGSIAWSLVVLSCLMRGLGPN